MIPLSLLNPTAATMRSFSKDPILATATATGNNNGGVLFDQAMIEPDEDFRNLTVKAIFKELSTIATALSFDDDDYYYDTNSSEEYRPVSARVETFVMSAVLGLIFIVGVLGNGTLIAIFLRHRGMRNIPNT